MLRRRPMVRLMPPRHTGTHGQVRTVDPLLDLLPVPAPGTLA